MHRYLLVLLSFCLLCVVGLTLLRPGPDVRLEAEVLRLSPEEGLALLDRRRDTMTYTANLDLLHARLALSAGRIDQAETLYGNVLARSGDTPPPELLEEMARAALLKGDRERATAYLARAYERGPDAARRRVLGLHYRSLREAAAETALLRSVKLKELEPDERARLAELLVAARDFTGYEAVLTGAAALDGAEAAWSRAALLSFLVETGRGDEAVSAARGWVSKTPDPAAVTTGALRTLLGRGAWEEAAAFAFAVIASEPDLGAVMPRIFAARGYGVLSRAIQMAWLDADDTLDADDWDALAAFVTLTGDLGGVRRSLWMHPDADVPAETFMLILRFQGAAALAPYRARIDAATLEARPLLGAALAAWSARPEETYVFLNKAARTDLSAWDREIWAHAASSLKGSPWLAALATEPTLGADYRVLATESLRAPASAVPAPDDGA